MFWLPYLVRTLLHVFLNSLIKYSVIGATIAQILYIRKSYRIDDLAFNLWPSAICAQLVQCLSIITACVPCLAPFLDSFESGIFRSDDLRRRGLTGSYSIKGRKTVLKSRPKLSSNDNDADIATMTDLSSIPLHPIRDIINTTNVRADPLQWDCESDHSRHQINCSTTWSIGVAPRA